MLPGNEMEWGVVFPGMREELLSSSTEETTNRYMLLIMCEDLEENVEEPRTGSLPTQETGTSLEIVGTFPNPLKAMYYFGRLLLI